MLNDGTWSSGVRAFSGDAEELDRRLVADEHELDKAVAREVAKDGARDRPAVFDQGVPN